MAYTWGSEGTCYHNNSSGEATTTTGYKARLGWELVNQSVENNSSTFNVRLQVKPTSDSYGTWGFSQTTTINGQTLASAKFNIYEGNGGTWYTFNTTTVTIAHNSEGILPEKTISGSFTTTGGTQAWILKKGSASVTIPTNAAPIITPEIPTPPIVGPLYGMIYIHNGTSYVRGIPFIHNGSKWVAGKGVEELG